MGVHVLDQHQAHGAAALLGHPHLEQDAVLLGPQGAHRGVGHFPAGLQVHHGDHRAHVGVGVGLLRRIGVDEADLLLARVLGVVQERLAEHHLGHHLRLRRACAVEHLRIDFHTPGIDHRAQQRPVPVADRENPGLVVLARHFGQRVERPDRQQRFAQAVAESFGERHADAQPRVGTGPLAHGHRVELVGRNAQMPGDAIDVAVKLGHRLPEAAPLLLGPQGKPDPVAAADGQINVAALPVVPPGPGAEEDNPVQAALPGQGGQCFLPTHAYLLTVPA